MTGGQQKPRDAFPVPPAIENLSPIRVADLALGTTHRGRVLRGRLITPLHKPYFASQSAMTVLEDDLGAVVKLAVYNCAESELRFLTEGSILAVKEPYYKVASDGTFMVRVDNPLEIAKLQRLGSQTSSELRDEGNTSFKMANHGSGGGLRQRQHRHSC